MNLEPDDQLPVYVISVAAQLAGLHAQTLRQWDRIGLVSPTRTPGGGRRYSRRDVVLAREVQRLSQDEGINLAGIKRILALQEDLVAARERVVQLEADLLAMAASGDERTAAVHAAYRRDLVPRQASALVVWRPHPRATR
ncbi:MAG: heat shock protein transcriptional repressor HspR [Actinomycetes bacterium]